MLEIDQLTVAYGTKLALQEVSLQVQRGEVVALIGPNGAGKSTLVRAVSGVLKFQSGRIRLGGQDLRQLGNRERARTLAVVPQARQLGGAFSVEQTVLMGRTAYMNWLGKPAQTDLQAVQLAMKRTAIEGLADRRNAELSGGEQQRVLLARALAQETPLLLLDEPTNHLDLQHQAGFLSLVRDLARREQLAVLLALHDLNQVSVYADRVALLVAGRILAQGPPAEVLTVENIRAAYQTAVQVLTHPSYNTPLILAQRSEET